MLIVVKVRGTGNSGQSLTWENKMRALATGSTGHLGEALMRTLRSRAMRVRGVDLKPRPLTDAAGAITGAAFVAHIAQNIDIVFCAAKLHKRRVVTPRSDVVFSSDVVFGPSR